MIVPQIESILNIPFCSLFSYLKNAVFEKVGSLLDWLNIFKRTKQFTLYESAISDARTYFSVYAVHIIFLL